VNGVSCLSLLRRTWQPETCDYPPGLSLPSPSRLIFASLGLGSVFLLARAALGGGFGGKELALVFLWVVFSTLGVFFPWLQMYVPALCRIPAGRAELALTFDDGPHPVSTRRVLALLAPTRHRATFFVLGDKVRRHPELAREILDAGHTLGIHGDYHDRLHSFRCPGRVAREIARARSSVEAACGVRPDWFRPPLGHTSPLTALGLRRTDVRVVGWSARGYDGLPGSEPTAIAARVEPDLKDGAIVLLHDAAERDDFEPPGVRALPEILAMLDARGLTSVGLR
jgi:peptidoglycan/xylan/chitin deacetylase (PgdA/CDA1 family)